MYFSASVNWYKIFEHFQQDLGYDGIEIQWKHVHILGVVKWISIIRLPFPN